MIRNEIDLSELTLIIHTFERKDFLLRQIAYLSAWKVNIEIVDGSKLPLDDLSVEYVNQFPNINYLHLALPVLDRIVDAAKRIRTPFVMCLADDDLFLQGGLAAAIDSLKRNEDAVACMGQAAGFDSLYGKYYAFEYGNNLSGYEVTGDCPQQRIQFAFSNWRPATWYAVYRTHIFKKVWDSAYTYKCPASAEYEQTIKTFIYGNLITSVEIYWLRSFETTPNVQDSSMDRGLVFSKWWNENLYSGDRGIFQNRILSLLRNSNAISNSSAQHVYLSIVDAILNEYESSFEVRNSSSHMIARTSKFIGSRFLIGRVKKSIFWKKQITPLIKYIGRKKFTTRSRLNVDITNEIKSAIQFCDLYANRRDL